MAIKHDKFSTVKMIEAIVTVPTFASLLHVRAVVGTCQHRHRVASVLGGETILEPSRHRVVENVKGKLKG